MITQENLYSMLAMLIPGILQKIMEERNVDEKEAANLLYNSELYNIDEFILTN